MKRLMRTYVIHLAAVWLTMQLLHPSFSIGGGLENILLAALIFSALNVLLKPILKLLFLPINALTVGLFSIVINTFVFYLFLRLFPQATLSAWTFPGLSYFGITVSTIPLNDRATLVVASILVMGITNFLAYLVK